ncbi:hypothetical protein CPB84DRAFT_1766968 [Gymnopilus junonius]|uniref:Uncharacterized protein n=1 Tax=Gymnopilus junonius TaxID=109634 RepID=A0A9P5TR28_GYMJU|nr:hypothetical protein CPB84DRAFT_1766968 [Gymnopilus junonius]
MSHFPNSATWLSVRLISLSFFPFFLVRICIPLRPFIPFICIGAGSTLLCPPALSTQSLIVSFLPPFFSFLRIYPCAYSINE